MNRNGKQNVTVGVVDGDSDYHAGLLPMSIRSRTPFRFYQTAREVLRRSVTEKNSFWLISVDLPDMTGFDLFEMLRDGLQRAPVCLVGRRYRPEDELRTYRAGAAMYACKPVERAWLWQSLCRLHAKMGERESLVPGKTSGTIPIFDGNASFLSR